MGNIIFNSEFASHRLSQCKQIKKRDSQISKKC